MFNGVDVARDIVLGAVDRAVNKTVAVLGVSFLARGMLIMGQWGEKSYKDKRYFDVRY